MNEGSLDADFRMIVVTSSNSSSSSAKMPCSMNLSLSQDLVELTFSSSSSSSGSSTSTSNDKNDSSDDASSKKSLHFRTALAECRALQRVGFSDPTVLERAQTDFLEQRSTTRKTAGAPIPQEADFHRWLTLTRLQARSRQSTSATVGDWERALALDLKAGGGQQQQQ